MFAARMLGLALAEVTLAVMAAPLCPMWAQSTVVLSGRVTDAVTGQPIEDAAVTLNASRTSYTDAGGNYSFAEATPGAAKVTIHAEGFAAFDKTNPDDVSILVPAERSEHNFKLTPEASITGRVTGDDGGGLPKFLVARLFQEVFTDGVRRFAGTSAREGSAGVAISGVDAADGSFRFRGLAPGHYLVCVGPPDGQFFEMSTKSGNAPRDNRPPEGYRDTYYPGTPDYNAALPISLAAGEDRTADFKVAKTRLFRVSGEVVTPAPEARKGDIQISLTGETLVPRSYSGIASVPGTFIVEGLPSGQYVAARITILGERIPNGPSGYSMSLTWMEVNHAFAITDHDVEGLKLIPLAAPAQLQVNGSFVMANQGTPLPAGLAAQFSYPQPGGQSDAIPTAPNGSFWLTGTAGDYSVRPVVPPGFAATEIRYGGGNYLNSLIPLGGDVLDSSLTIVLSNQPGSVSGYLLDKDQKPVAARIVLAPDPLPSGFDFRAFRVGNVDSQGAFAISGLAPGRYKAVALTGDDRKRDHDLAILRDRLQTADAFEVTAGQSTPIALHP